MAKYMIVVLDNEGRTFAFFDSDYNVVRTLAKDFMNFDHSTCEIYVRVMDHYELLEVPR